MAYNPLIPAANDLLSQSQNDIQANFAAINAFVNVDHAGLNAPDAGKHNKITLPNQATAPVFASTDLGIYNKVYPTAPLPGFGTGLNELFISKLIFGGSHQEIPLTASILSNVTAGSVGPGWLMLPSGIQLKWGSQAVPTLASLDVDFQTLSSGPQFQFVFATFVTPFSSLNPEFIAGLRESPTPLGAPTLFKVYANQLATTNRIFYLIIGV